MILNSIHGKISRPSSRLIQEVIQETQGKFESTSQDARCEIKLEYESMNIRVNEYPELFINNLEKPSRIMN